MRKHNVVICSGHRQPSSLFICLITAAMVAYCGRVSSSEIGQGANDAALHDEVAPLPRQERLRSQEIFKHEVDHVVFTVEWEVLEEIRDPEDKSDVPLARRLVARFQTDALERALFDGNRDKGLAKLNQILERELSLVDQVVQLSHQQKQKLRLASRGDLQRLLEQIELLKPDFEQPHDVEERGRNEVRCDLRILMFKAAQLRKRIDESPSGPDSLFEKTLRKQLSPGEYQSVVTERKKLRPTLNRGMRNGFILDVF